MLFGPLAGSATYMWSQYEKKKLEVVRQKMYTEY